MLLPLDSSLNLRKAQGTDSFVSRTLVQRAITSVTMLEKEGASGPFSTPNHVLEVQRGVKVGGIRRKEKKR